MKKKILVSFKDNDKMLHYSSIGRTTHMPKKEDPFAFTIPCTIRLLHFSKALCNLGTRINIMHLSIYKKLDLGDQNSSMMQLLMTDRTVKRLI